MVAETGIEWGHARCKSRHEYAQSRCSSASVIAACLTNSQHEENNFAKRLHLLRHYASICRFCVYLLHVFQRGHELASAGGEERVGHDNDVVNLECDKVGGK